MTTYRNVYFCYYKTRLFQIALESSHVRLLFFKWRGHFPSKPGCVSGRTGSASATAGQEATSPPPTITAPKNNLKKIHFQLIWSSAFRCHGAKRSAGAWPFHTGSVSNWLPISFQSQPTPTRFHLLSLFLLPLLRKAIKWTRWDFLKPHIQLPKADGVEEKGVSQTEDPPSQGCYT